MPVIGFNSNVSSLSAQRELGKATSGLGRAFERLSSGRRINRASDDAAGLAIADTLHVGNRLYSAAQRNINDGISLLSIMDSSLSQQTDIITRLTELAEQASSGSFSSSQRSALNTEYQQLLQEFGRLADTTRFNGVNLMRADHRDGSAEINLQAGISGASSSRIVINGVESTRFSGIADLARIHGDYDDGTGTGSPDTGVTIDDLLYVQGLSAAGATFEQLSRTFDNSIMNFEVTDSTGRKRSLLVTLSGVFEDGSDPAQFGTGPIGVSFWVKDDTSGKYSLVNLNGNTGLNAHDSNSLNFDSSGRITGTAIVSGTLDFGSGVSASANLDFSGLRFIDSRTGNSPTAIDFTGLETQSRARNALDVSRKRLAALGVIRGQLGAAERRLAVALELSRVSAENFAAAESRIRDADIADESAGAVRLSILQQVGSAVLAQANTIPSLALKLLQ